MTTLSQPHASPLLISIIVVDPHGTDALSAALDDLRDARLALPCEVIAVFGGDDPARLALMQQRYPLVSWKQARTQHDLGTLYSLGATAARGRYLLLLDGTVRVDRGTIEGMVHFMEKGQWVGVVGPRLVMPSGRDLPSSRKFPTVATALAESRGETIETVSPRIANPLNRQVTMPKEVDAVVAGCVMIKRQTFVETGDWDAGYPPGGEALDWCRRARLKGWSVFYHPGLPVHLHREGGHDPARVAADLASACRFIGRYHGPFDRLTLQLLLALFSVRAMLLEGGASLIPGGHRQGARDAFERAWYVMGALLRPGRRRWA